MISVQYVVIGRLMVSIVLIVIIKHKYVMNEDLELKLLESGKLYLIEEITNQTSSRLLKEMDYLLSLKLESALLYINSEGGETSDARAIIDKILSCEKNGLTITGIGLGEAFSSAAIILGMCPYRLISDNSSLTLHHMSIEVPPDYSDQQSRYTQFFDLEYNNLIIKLANRCDYKSKRAVEKFITNVKQSWYLNSKEAVRAKLVDGIW